MHFNKKMVLLPILFCIIAHMTGIKANAETMYENPDNGYVVVIEDDADLFTPEEEKELGEFLEEVTQYGNVAVKTITHNEYSAKKYGNMYFDQLFGPHADGTILLIDMDNREIVLTSEGRVKKAVSSSSANSIMDNVYSYASSGEYYRCSVKTFEQVLNLLNGEKIARPMKYICNIFLAVICAVLINYWIVRKYSKEFAPEAKELLDGAFSRIDLKDYHVENINREEIRTYRDSGGSSDSGSSFGGSSSSGGGSSSGGSSSHSSGSHRF
ncbi:MAG: TPM domain-containing protein [Lachnospira sp.]